MSLKRTSKVVLVVLCAVTFFGLTVSQAGAATDVRSARTALSLKMIIPFPLPDYSQWVVAKRLGFWEKYGLDLSFTTNTGANSVNLIVAGQADLVAFTGASAAQVALQGKTVTGVLASQVNPGSALVTRKDITSLSQLRNTANCRWAAAPVGSNAYYHAKLYQFSLGVVNKCNLVQLATTGLQAQGVVSGAFDATVVGYSTALLMVQQGANMLIDPLSDQYERTYGRSAALRFIPGLVWGTKENLASKRDAVAAFIRGALDAANYIWTHNDRQVATVLRNDPLFNTTPMETLTDQVRAVRPFIGINTNPQRPNYFTERAWVNALKVFGQYGLQGFDTTSSAVTYRSIVDMSYYTQARPKAPFIVDAKTNTLREIAAKTLGSAAKWRQLYNVNKVWFDTFGLKASQIANARLKTGLPVWLA